MKLILLVEFQQWTLCVHYTPVLVHKKKRFDSIILDYILIRKFTELCNEETPMVRRAVAIKIGEIAQFMDKAHVINDLIPI